MGSLLPPGPWTAKVSWAPFYHSPKCQIQNCARNLRKAGRADHWRQRTLGFSECPREGLRPQEGPLRFLHLIRIFLCIGKLLQPKNFSSVLLFENLSLFQITALSELMEARSLPRVSRFPFAVTSDKNVRGMGKQGADGQTELESKNTNPSPLLAP